MKNMKAKGLVDVHTQLGLKNKGITLIALVITILLSYDDIRKYSNINKFLLPINC